MGGAGAVKKVDFIGDKGTLVFHRSKCDKVFDIDFQNVVRFKSAADAVAKDYKPCEICNPD